MQYLYERVGGGATGATHDLKCGSATCSICLPKAHAVAVPILCSRLYTDNWRRTACTEALHRWHTDMHEQNVLMLPSTTQGQLL